MTPFPRSYWVIPGVLLAGEFPAAKTQEEAKNKIDALINCGIRQIINLMEPHETDHSGALFNNYELIVSQLEKERSVSVRCLKLPIADLSTPTASTMRKIIDAIMSGIEDHRPVYVHCWGGIGRTGTVVGCFLLENGLATPGNVLNVIAELRNNDPKQHRVSPETDAQRKFVITWREKNDGPPTLLSRSIGCLLEKVSGVLRRILLQIVPKILYIIKSYGRTI
jgi:protein-tyrosine phosphatase